MFDYCLLRIRGLGVVFLFIGTLSSCGMGNEALSSFDEETATDGISMKRQRPMAQRLSMKRRLLMGPRRLPIQASGP